MDSKSTKASPAAKSKALNRVSTAPVSSRSRELRIHSVWRAPALLPASFPSPFSTFTSYTNSKGLEIPLLHRDKVTRVLRQLDTALRPIVTRFKVRYTVLAENHPHEKLAAFTLEVDKLYCIRVRIRSPACPNDIKKIYRWETLLALLFHELAHVRYMHHGTDFRLLLRDIYRYAAEIGTFQVGQSNQIPSCRGWENRCFETAGAVSDREIASLVEETKDCETFH